MRGVLRGDTGMNFCLVDDQLLIELRKFQFAISASDLPDRVKNLRGRTQKPIRELWNGTLFGFCFSRTFSIPQIAIASVEEEDAEADVVLRIVKDGEFFDKEVQIKELVPEKNNPDATLEGLFAQIGAKHYRSKDLIVAVYANRFLPGSAAYDRPKLDVAQLWVFGPSKPDQSEYYLWGDLLRPGEQEYIVKYPGYV